MCFWCICMGCVVQVIWMIQLLSRCLQTEPDDKRMFRLTEPSESAETYMKLFRLICVYWRNCFLTSIAFVWKSYVTPQSAAKA